MKRSTFSKDVWPGAQHDRRKGERKRRQKKKKHADIDAFFEANLPLVAPCKVVLTEEERKMTSVNSILERMIGGIGGAPNHVPLRQRLLKGKNKEKAVRDDPPPKMGGEGRTETWNDGINVYMLDEDAAQAREYEEGVKKLKTYVRPGGKVWDAVRNGPKESPRPSHRPPGKGVFGGIEKMSARRSARHEARRTKQRVGSKQMSRIREEAEKIIEKVAVWSCGDFSVTSPLVYMAEKATELTSEGFLSWLNWMVQQERSWATSSLPDAEIARRYGRLGMHHHERWMLKKFELNGRRHVRDISVICENVWRQKRALVEMMLDPRNASMTRPLHYNGRGGVVVEGCAEWESQCPRPGWRNVPRR